jgi:hypothetical protein
MATVKVDLVSFVWEKGIVMDPHFSAPLMECLRDFLLSEVSIKKKTRGLGGRNFKLTPDRFLDVERREVKFLANSSIATR